MGQAATSHRAAKPSRSGPPIIKIIEGPLKLLGEYAVECVIIGGVAATLYGSTILTSDLDVCNARNAENLEKLASALQSVCVLE